MTNRHKNYAPGWQAGGGNKAPGGTRSKPKYTTSHQRYAIPIYVNDIRVGEVIGNVFHKWIYGSKHLLRRPPAIAFDIDSLLQAEQAGAEWAVIHDRETQTTYRASLKAILKQGKRFNRRHGVQIYLPLGKWVITRPGEHHSEQLWMF